MTKKKDYQKAYKSGPGSHQDEQLFFYIFLFFVSFFKECIWCFLYLSNVTLNIKVREGALLTDFVAMCCAKPTILSYFIQRLYYCPCSSTVFKCYLAIFIIPTLSSSGYTVVIMYIVLCALSYVQVFYTFFLSSLLSPYIGQMTFWNFHVFGTLLEYKHTRISYIWFDSTKFLPNKFPSCPCCWHLTSVK